MQRLATVLSLGLGAAAVALVVSIQQDRFAFTSYAPPSTAEVNAMVALRPEPEPVLIELPAATSNQELRFEAIRVVAPPPRQPIRAKQLDEPAVKVVPAPCVDGEYRELSPGHGVTLMCSPESLGPPNS